MTMTDVQLMDGFVGARSDEAFQALVSRHGPTVMRACRRVLQDPHEIEDAFQSTFLVLVNKAPAVRDPQALGNWLYGVALRVAAQARRNAARRRRHERQAALDDPTEGAPDLSIDDLRRVVHEELASLPDVYRLPLSLCYLDGQSHEAAAAELGWPLGTLKVRLVRGRERLRDRLDRRKVSVGAGFLLWLLGRGEAGASTNLHAGTESDPTPLNPSDPVGRTSTTWRSPARWVYPLLLVLALSLAVTFGLSLRSRADASDRDAFAALPASLTDVLNVECR